MKILTTDFSDVFIIKSEKIIDKRGWFVENFRLKDLELHFGHQIKFCQENKSFSKHGVLRGLHYQLPPYAQSKLVSVLSGKVLDVIVDIKKGSPTFGKYISIELSSVNQLQVFIPRGYAHGYICLSKSAIFSYKVDNYYCKEAEGSISFDDPKLAINWQLDKKDIIVSKKDLNHPFIDEAKCFEVDKPLYE